MSTSETTPGYISLKSALHIHVRQDEGQVWLYRLEIHDQSETPRLSDWEVLLNVYDQETAIMRAAQAALSSASLTMFGLSPTLVPTSRDGVFTLPDNVSIQVSYLDATNSWRWRICLPAHPNTPQFSAWEQIPEALSIEQAMSAAVLRLLERHPLPVLGGVSDTKFSRLPFGIDAQVRRSQKCAACWEWRLVLQNLEASDWADLPESHGKEWHELSMHLSSLMLKLPEIISGLHSQSEKHE